MTNGDVARRLRAHASNLARGRDNLYRVRAFRQAAVAVLGLTDEVESLVARGGPQALERIPGIGKSLADAIVHITLGDGSSPHSDQLSRGVAGAGS